MIQENAEDLICRRKDDHEPEEVRAAVAQEHQAGREIPGEKTERGADAAARVRAKQGTAESIRW